MNTKVLFFFGVLALAAADRRPTYSYGSPESSSASEESYESSEAQYNFNWAVSDESSENHFGHQEARDGDDTQGSYYVNLPDGRRQIVTFHVDGDDGYIAEVAYSGEAEFPSAESYEGSDESYEAPRRTYYAPDSNESK